MKRELTHIEPVRAAVISTLLYFLLVLPVIAYNAIVSLFGSAGASAADLGYNVLAHLLYGLVGFLVTLIGVCCYNLMARRFGGIRFTIHDR